MRSLITFRENGLGYTGIKTFCKLMNMREPMSKSSYENSLSDLHIAYMCKQLGNQCVKQLRKYEEVI